jgi:hypothetical protein
MARVLYPINHLRSFPITNTELEELCILINKYNPELPVETLQEVMDKFFTQEFKYDNKTGTYQNIMQALKYLDGSWFTDQL